MIVWCAAALAGSSQLWGEVGEDWDPAGRLPDYSWAGFKGGRELPDVPVDVDVTDFGARGNGKADDTQAFKDAIAATTGAIHIPAGDYRLTDVLEIDHGVVLRGAGPDKTRLQFEVSLTDVRGAQPQWSFNGGLIWVSPGASGARLATVTRDAERADRTLRIDDASNIRGGDIVVLRLTDDSDDTLGSHMHNDQVASGTCTYQQPIVLNWPVQVDDVDGNTVTLTQALRLDVRGEWQPELHSVPWVRGFGLESVTVAFPDEPYPGHLLEAGYNGVFLQGGVVNSWVRDVQFVNADNAVLTDTLTKWVTVTDITLSGRKGHHGFNVAFTADSLFSDIHLEQDHVHSFTLDHRASGNVAMRLSYDGDVGLIIDHHKDASFENLFTDIGDVLVLSGGNTCAGFPGGARNTYWNVGAPLTPPWWGHIQTNAVGHLDTDERLTDDREWFEPVAQLWPDNLYLSQRARRLGGSYDPPTVKDPGDNPARREAKRGCGCQTTSLSPWWLVAGMVVRRPTRRRGRLGTAPRR